MTNENNEKDPLLDELEERIAEGPVILTPDEEFLKLVEERRKKRMSKKIKSVCIVGGGSWLDDCCNICKFPNMDITIIESPDFPILGVGESTLGSIKHWTSLIGLEDKDFLTETDVSC